ncbi:caspase family protein [Candidatus Sulfurimonas baltica]|uniref:caspase family protein n=1 Tax=Candidatus Sulfurimonas baltica TaxID=2740404 RepID=UPI001E5463AE|nr:caspase family protein [Candidatus Sulfurimonas baltica]
MLLKLFTTSLILLLATGCGNIEPKVTSLDNTHNNQPEASKLKVTSIDSTEVLSNKIVWDGSKSEIDNNEYQKIITNYSKQKYPEKYKNIQNSINNVVNQGNIIWQDNIDTKTVRVNLYDAEKYCKNLNFSGHGNWYLPSEKQLVDLDQKNIKYYLDSYYWAASGSVVGFKTKSIVNPYGAFPYYVRCISDNTEVLSNLAFNNILEDQEKVSIITNHLILKKYNLEKDKFEKTSDFKKRVDYVKNNIEEITNVNMSKAYNKIYAKPLIKSIDYDADNELFYGKLTSSEGQFSKDIAINIPLEIAKDFYKYEKKVKVIYEYRDEKVFLKNIVVPYEGKIYSAVLRDADYKPNDIKVAIYKQIEYGENIIKEYQNDIPKFLENSKSGKTDNTKWLFIVGIENYEFTDSVKYSENSAEQIKSVMKKRLGIPENNVRTLINQGATSAKIDYNLKDMLRRVKSGDTIYFYYSGHGIPVPSQNNEPYMLAQDMNPAYLTDERFKLQNIYKSLSNSKATKVVAFIDSCFSGGTDNQALIKGVAATRIKPKSVTFDTSKMIVISAGSGTQYSNKYDEKGNRLFSYFVMRGLIENNSNTQRLYDYVKSNVQEKSYEMGASYEQVPVYNGNIGLEL